jgi:uncharacterized protein DUF6178
MPSNGGANSDAFNSLPFRDQLDALYAASPRDRLELIVNAPNPQRLVRSFAAEGLFHTLKGIGREDSSDLLALASGEQVSALVDLDCWRKDRLETSTLLDWLEVIVEAGPRAIGEFLNVIDIELLVLLLKRFIAVRRRDDPEEPEEDVEGQEVFELDEHYEIAFHRWDARGPLVRQLIEALHERDYSYFVTVMEEIWWGVESDLEETSFLRRNARMQDRGFPDYFEAQEVYRPMGEKDLAERTQRLGRPRQDGDGADVVPQERALIHPGDGPSFLSQVLNTGFAGDEAGELRQELAFLANRVLIAEGADFANRDDVAEKIRMAHDTVNLALELISGRDVMRATAVLQRHYVQHLFRFAWGELFALRKSAKQVVQALGIPAPAGEVSFLDSPYREALAGLLRPKPRYFEGIDRPGEIRFRPFAGFADLERAKAMLEDMTSIPDLCRRLLGQSPSQIASLRPADADEFRLSAALLTGFSHFALGRAPSLEPLAPADLVELRRVSAEPGTENLAGTLRSRFLQAMAARGRFLEFSLRRFEEEFLSIPLGAELDPRFVTCLMIGLPKRRANG